MTDLATSIPLVLSTFAVIAATGLAVRRIRQPDDQRRSPWPQHLIVGGVGLVCAAVFIVRVVFVHRAWLPVQAHVDGLLLIAALLAPAILFIQARPKLFGLSIFALPLLTLLLAWGVCASLWTYRPFKLDTFEPVWVVFHLGSIYLGLLSCGVGAAGGAMYLFVQSRLKAKTDLAQVNPMASLETLETLIIRAATLGFVLLTLALVSGLILVTRSDQATSLGQAWWSSPKVWIATAAWALYAVLMNARSSSTFRGRRAAWLAIAGLVLVLATYGAVELIDHAPLTPGDGTAATSGGAV